MANEFKIKKGLIVNGSGSAILDIQGSQGQLLTVTDNTSGSILTVKNTLGTQILQVSSDDSVKLGTFNAEAIKVSGSNAIITGSLFGTSSWAVSVSTASYVTPLTQDVTITGSFLVSGSTTQIGDNNLLGNTYLSGSINISGNTTLTGSLTALNQTASFGYVSASFLDVTGKQTIKGYAQFLPTSDIVPIATPGGYIYSSGSQGDLYFAQTNGSINNVVRLRWIEGNMYSGLLNGGVITTQSSTVYQVSSGSGIIVSLNGSLSSDPYPAVDYLSWNNLSASIAPLSASFDQSFVAIEASGSTGIIYAQGTPYDDGQFNTLIPIGNVIHQNRTSINATATYPSVAYGYKQRSSDFIRAFGPLKLTGLDTIVSGSSTGSLQITSGKSYSEGRNYITDVNNPSYVQDTGQPISKIFRYYQSGSGWVYLTNGGAGFETIDPTQYSLNGVLTPVPGTGANREFSIQRVFYFPGGATKGIYVYYGNQTYPTALAAIANIPYESFIEAPNTSAGAILSAYLVVRNNADFTVPDSYNIRPAGLFRNIGGTGGAGGAIAQTLSGLSDVDVLTVLPTNGQPLVYDSATVKWKNASSLTANLTGTASFATTASFVSGIVATASFATTSSNVLGGAANYIPLWNTATSLSSSALYQSASNIGIGTTTPSAKVQIVGSLIQGDSNNTALGPQAHAQGANTTASGSYSHAEGNSTQALGDSSHAEGQNTIATGASSHAEGESTSALGLFSHAEGIDAISLGFYSHAEGDRTVAFGTGSHAEGYYTSASGNYSHTEGVRTTASGSFSHAEGDRAIALGYASHAEGSLTVALGDYSHAEGLRTLASGSYSHAEGRSTTASGQYSHAAGYSTVASGSHQSVIGQFNISSSAQSAFIVGNGTADNTRSNLIFASGSSVQVTGSLSVTNGITGSLFGTSSWAISTSNAVSSSYSTNIVGAANYIPKFTGANTLSSSLIYDNGTGVMVGTITPAARLTVTSAGSGTGINGTAIYAYSNGGPTIEAGAANSSSILAVNNSVNSSTLVAQNIGSGPIFSLKNNADTNVFHVLNNGNVGISTITPGAPLHVNGNLIAGASTTSGLFFNTANDTLVISNQRAIERSGSGLYYGNANTLLQLRTNSTARLHIDNTGNIGIGTTVPTAKLHIAAPGATNYILKAPAENGNQGFEIYRPSNNNTVLQWYSSGNTVVGSLSDASGTGIAMGGNWSTNGIFSIQAQEAVVPFELYTPYYGGLTALPVIRIRDRSNNVLGATMIELRQNGGAFFSGSVGIGISGSAYKLDVNGTTRINGNTVITGSLTVTQGITGSLFGTSSWAVSASWAPVQVSGSYALTSSLATNVVGSANRILFNNATNTTTTSNNLTWTDSTNLLTLGDATGTAGTISKLALYTSSYGGYGLGVSPGQLDYVSDGSHVFYKNGTTPSELVRITNAGNVGIGTTSPTTLLDLYSSGGGVSFKTYTSTTNYTEHSYSKDAGFFIDSYQSVAGNPYTKTTDLVANADSGAESQMRFFTATTVSSPLERMRITSAGNVGIGTTSPNAKLEVNGNAIITGSLNVTAGITGSLFGTASWAQNVTTATNAQSASNFVITSTLQLDGTLTDYATVNSTIVGSNNLYTQATGSYTSAFVKYTVSKGANVRAGQFMTAWSGSTTIYTDTSTGDLGNTSDIVFSSAIVSSQIQVNAVAASSGWKIKTLATFI